MSDMHEPEEPDRPWVLDLPEGTTLEQVADSLAREAEAIAALNAAPVFVRRGDGEWLEVSAEDRRGRAS